MKNFLVRRVALLVISLFGLYLAACSTVQVDPDEPSPPLRPKIESAATSRLDNMPDVSNKTPSPRPLQIEGNVVDSRTGEPLPTATIYVNGSAEPAPQSGSTITDEGLLST